MGLHSFDRRFGAGMRARTEGVPGGLAAARICASGLAPAFRLVVALLIARPGMRRSGAEALAAAFLASQAALVLRERVGRPRPGARPDAGLPSRHAAAAVAIARAVGRHRPQAGILLLCVAAAGLLGRIATAEHDPADVVSGAVLGWGADRALERILGGDG